MIEDAQREDFRNKVSSIAFMVRTQNYQVDGEIGEWVAKFNAADDSKVALEDMVETFWQRPVEERTQIIKDLFAKEDELQSKQNEEADSFDFFND